MSTRTLGQHFHARQIFMAALAAVLAGSAACSDSGPSWGIDVAVPRTDFLTDSAKPSKLIPDPNAPSVQVAITIRLNGKKVDRDEFLDRVTDDPSRYTFRDDDSTIITDLPFHWYTPNADTVSVEVTILSQPLPNQAACSVTYKGQIADLRIEARKRHVNCGAPLPPD